MSDSSRHGASPRHDPPGDGPPQPSRTQRPEDGAGANGPAGQRLRADLALPAGRFGVGAGGAVALPDDPRVVAALLGHQRDRAHRLVLDGRRLDRRSPAARVRAGLASVGDAPVAPDVSVADHLRAVVGRRRAVALLAETPHLASLGDRMAGALSGGERRLLAWVLARALDPTVVVLDRAGTGLDGEALAWATTVVRAWRRAGAGLLVRVGREEERAWLEQRP